MLTSASGRYWLVTITSSIRFATDTSFLSFAFLSPPSWAETSDNERARPHYGGLPTTFKNRSTADELSFVEKSKILASVGQASLTDSVMLKVRLSQSDARLWKMEVIVSFSAL